MELHEKQLEFLYDDCPIKAFVGGIGAGKSVSGAAFALTMINNNPEWYGLIISNTTKQLNTSTLPVFTDVLADAGWVKNIHYVINKDPYRFYGYKSKFPDHSGIWSFYHGAQILTFSLESMMRGIEVAWCWLDEVQDSKKSDLDMVTGRVRQTNTPYIRYTMTPPQANPDINEMIFGENSIPKVHATSYDNPHLPRAYLQLLEDTYDPITFDREVMGMESKDTSNRFAYCFEDRHISEKAIYRPKETVYLSLDHNINPMTCVVWQQGTHRGKPWIHYIDEIVIGNSNIYEMCERINMLYGNDHLIVTGDATSRKGDVNLRSNDKNTWTITRQELRLGPAQMRVPRKNPDTRDAYVLVNSILAKHPEILFHPKMKNAIRDMRFVKVDHEIKIIKKNRKDLTQQADLMDCIKYSLYNFHGDFVRVEKAYRQTA